MNVPADAAQGARVDKIHMSRHHRFEGRFSVLAPVSVKQLGIGGVVHGGFDSYM
ncbi:MAG: hypothetical protein ABIR80_00570 [Opitutaceae bacterium]